MRSGSGEFGGVEFECARSTKFLLATHVPLFIGSRHNTP